jgi:hypothetical protein
VKGELARVAKGYARNYLLPYSKALYATPENVKRYEADRAVRMPFVRGSNSPMFIRTENRLCSESAG